MTKPTRRSTFSAQPVTYAAVGATLEPDLTVHPPKGFRSFERAVRLGSGAERFATSSRALMTWGVQRGSDVAVTRVDPGTGEEYAGIHYAPDGTPERLIEHRGTEAVFDEDGNPYISNGMTAVLRVPFGPFHFRAPVRVVYVIEDDRRIGFGYGTMRGHPLSGEESFVVEHRDDDSVWLVVRSFSRTGQGRGLVAPFVKNGQGRLMKRYLRALHPVAGSPGVASAAPDAEAQDAEVRDAGDVAIHDAAVAELVADETVVEAEVAPAPERPQVERVSPEAEPPLEVEITDAVTHHEGDPTDPASVPLPPSSDAEQSSDR